jgi:hypothetical protein
MGHLKNHPVLITTHAEKKRRHIILIKLFFKGFQKEYYSNGLFIYSAKTRLPAKTRHRRVDCLFVCLFSRGPQGPRG